MTDETSLATDGVVVRCPTWGCRCGTDGNSCSRAQCRNCGATAPARLRKLALEEVNKRKKQNKQTNHSGKSAAKGNAFAKLSDRLRTCRRSCRPEGKQKVMTIRLMSPGGPKGCLNGCSPSRRQQVYRQRPPAPEESPPTPDFGIFRQCADALRAQQLAVSLAALANEHRAAKQKEKRLARRFQQLDFKIEKKKRSVGSLETTHRDLSKFIQHLQALLQNTNKQVQDAKTELGQLQTERSEVVKGRSSSGEQNEIEQLLRRALPQPDETLSQQMEAVVRAAAAFRARSTGPGAADPTAQDLQAAQEGETAVGDGCALAVGAVGCVRFKSQRRSFSVITANVTSWGCGRHYLEQELPGLAVIQEHPEAQS